MFVRNAKHFNPSSFFAPSLAWLLGDCARFYCA